MHFQREQKTPTPTPFTNTMTEHQNKVLKDLPKPRLTFGLCDGIRMLYQCIILLLRRAEQYISNFLLMTPFSMHIKPFIP